MNMPASRFKRGVTRYGTSDALQQFHYRTRTNALYTVRLNSAGFEFNINGLPTAKLPIHQRIIDHFGIGGT